MKLRIRIAPNALLAAGAWVTLFAVVTVRAQAPATNAAPRAAGFSYMLKDLNGRNAARVSGADKKVLSPVTDGNVQIRELRIDTFNADGTPNLVGEAPDCVLNIPTASLSSSGTLTVTQVGGAFTLKGEGFMWNHKTERLQLSNHVHAVFRGLAPGTSLQFKK